MVSLVLKQGGHIVSTPRVMKPKKPSIYRVKLNFKKKKTQQVKKITEEIMTKLIEFYNKDDASRWTPGKQEYVITRTESGKKVKLEKC